jgi:hypothetical protein
VVAARPPRFDDPGHRLRHRDPGLRGKSAGLLLDRAERALRSLTDSVTRPPDTADGRPHLQAVVGSRCLGMTMAVVASGYLGMNMAVVTVVAGPDGTLALRGVAFEGIVKQRAGRKAVELCRTRLLRNHDGAGSRAGAWPAGGRHRRPSSAVLSHGRGSSLEERHAVQPAERRARSYQNCRSSPHP